MFELKFSKTYDNNIYTKYNIKPVIEDYFIAKENIFCVSDGVTKDLKTRELTKYPTTLDEIKNIMLNYPNPSGSFEAAKICGQTFLKQLTNKEQINQQVILEAVKEANKKIHEINKNREINYLEEDLHCCVATGGAIYKNNLYCFCIGDCSIVLLDKNFNKIFTTPKTDNFLEYKKYLKTLGLDGTRNEYRYMIRKFVRNNINLTNNGQNIAYGALTGEKTAESFIKIFKLELKNVKYICAFSDGCDEYFKDKQTIKKIIQNPEIIAQNGQERTIVIYEDSVK